MLTSLSAKLIHLFLQKPKSLTLEEAAKIFLGHNASSSKIRTKVRRLYDISNVFLALNIIDKTFIGTRKPAYNWIGLTGF